MLTSSIAIALGGCGTGTPEVGEADAPDDAVATDLTVMTTILPITQFTNAVVGDRAEVILLMPTDVDPHDFQASPADVQALANADVLVKNGLEMEVFLDDLVANAENPDLVTIDSSEGIAVISNETVEGHSDGKANDADHDHEHSDAAAADADHDHEHAEGEAHDHAEGGHHHHGEYNPHIWLDPKRAIQQVENIRDGMIAVDPEGADIYTANAAAFIAELETLDAEISEQLAPFSGQPFVAFHDFAPYFAESYNLQAEFLVDVPEENPSPEDVKRVMDTVQASNLKTILTEPTAGEDAFGALAQDLGIQVGMFNPLEVGGSDSVQPDYYLSTMRQNATNLVTSFEGTTQSWLPLWSTQPVAVVPQGVGLRF
ncbi:MAG: zinc ABC transporter solute-binding protein [Leptolyngbyaceae cyanobacterium SL_1_1]|nr:zinc ABC transporter solute-binding protein [Leptolyngbyaceae cyanobacterium SL_1_1]